MANRSLDFLPEVFRTPVNQKFLNATVEQLISEPNLKKLNGYIGRQFAPTFKASDNYLPEPTAERQNYQLEPCVTSTDEDGNIKFFNSYTDLVQQIWYNDGLTANHSRLFSNETYTFDGLFDFDKLVNFNQYYWLPVGPDPVNVYALAEEPVRTFDIIRDEQSETYKVQDFKTMKNPTLTLVRGGSYTFNVNQPGSQFWIQTDPGTDGKRPRQSHINTREVFGVTNNGEDNGAVTFNVPQIDGQDRFVNMPLVRSVDFVTNLHFNDIHRQLIDLFIETHGGIDGITTNLVGKYIAFIHADVSEADWTEPGIYALDKWGNNVYDQGNIIPMEQRVGIWQIRLQDAGEGDQLIKLVWDQDIPKGHKIFVKSGEEFANKEFYKQPNGLLDVVPLITAPLSVLYYNDGTDQHYAGRINLVDSIHHGIDVPEEILGKQQYLSPNGVEFTNGLKVRFDISAQPATYQNQTFYVEGVGKGIRLVNIEHLTTPEFDHRTESVPFDVYGFGEDLFDQTLNGPVVPDYITINRSSIDCNAWSRSNRWFHHDVIAATAAYNEVTPKFDQLKRATRPIVEFDPDLQLFNNGRISHHNVGILDFTVTDALSTVEGQVGEFATALGLEDGMTIIFANDFDPRVRNQVFTVNLIDINGVIKVHLTEVDGGQIDEYSTVTPTIGAILSLNAIQPDLTEIVAQRTISLSNNVAVTSVNQILATNIGLSFGNTFWYNNAKWVLGQGKSEVNVSPLFDIIDSELNSFSDTTVYPSTTFEGCALFSFKVGSGINDGVLGFPLSYRSFANIGDIEFQNNFDTDVFSSDSRTINVNSGFVPTIESRLTLSRTNVWETQTEQSKQYQVVTYLGDGISQNFEIDILPSKERLVPTLKVSINNKRLLPAQFSLVTTTGNKIAVNIVPKVLVNDRVDIQIYSTLVTSGGYYEVPANLEFNSLNQNFTELTLGQFRNHLTTIASNSNEVVGQVPGLSNLRDLDIKARGGSILQHSAPTIYGSLFLSNREVDFIRSSSYAQSEYSKFKSRFLESYSSVVDAGIKDAALGTDLILKKINAFKGSHLPWYYSDMVPYDDDNVTLLSYTVLNIELREYEIDQIFNDTELSNKAILVYLNGKQLTRGYDYTFSQTRPAVVFLAPLAYDDEIVIKLYQNTDGCFIPETPTKLGLYPKFTPAIYLDRTYRTPTWVIRGHDGSITPKFNDFRDELLLELETRIYNNIKSDHNKSLDIHELIPGKFRITDYTKTEFNQILARCFLTWVGSNRTDYSTNQWFVSSDPWSWTYNQYLDSLSGEALPGYWRGIYNYFFDTDAPNERPWEMLGFSEMPDWWVDTYGPAPYTGGNLVLWGDLEQGIIQKGIRAGQYSKYARPGLSKIIPVTETGELRAPSEFLVGSFNSIDASGVFQIGDEAPVEAAWRRSSNYPFAIQQVMSLMKPAVYFGRLFDVQNYYKRPDINQFVHNETNQRVTPSLFRINGEVRDDNSIVRNAGYLNWIVDYTKSNSLDPVTVLRGYLDTVNVQLGYKVAGFTDKNYLRVLAEQSSPSSTNDSVVIPNENYRVHLHKSAPVNRIVYSAVIIEKTFHGYSVSGYNSEDPFFRIIPSLPSSRQHRVEVAGATGVIYDDFQDTRVTVPYGFEFKSKQQLIDFLVSYGRYLVKQGYTFEEFNQDLQEVMNWELSVKEFLSWTQQGWSAGSILVVSPVLNAVSLSYPNAVVDKVENHPTGSKILDVGFNTVKGSMFNIYRDDTTFSVTAMPEISLGLVDLTLVQYEHVLIFDNQTVFNDVIYKPELGNRQFRLKLIGNKTNNWTGRINPPGFILSDPTVESWASGKDYLKGDMVRFKSFIYAALQNVDASDAFNFSKWTRIDESTFKTGMLPNLSYNAKKFENMYDVDSQTLDQKINVFSNGLIGHRERTYLSDLSLNSTTQTKFYQGYIREKGTLNSVSALSSALFSNLSGAMSLNEEWAFRVGEYGATESNQFFEVQLSDSTYVHNPISLTLSNDISLRESDEVVVETSSSLFKKSARFNTNVFSNRPESALYEGDVQTAGFVNLNDIDATIFDVEDYQQLNSLSEKVHSGFKLWVAKDTVSDWNVYRVDEASVTVTGIVYSLDNFATFTTYAPHNIKEGDLFVVRNFLPEADGFYRALKVDRVTVMVTVLDDLAAKLKTTPFIDGNGVIFKMSSMRVDHLTQVTGITPMYGWKESDRVWVDRDNENSQWGVYKKIDPWTFTTALPGLTTSSNSANYGSRVSVTPDGNIIVVTAPGSTTDSITMMVKNDDGTFTEKAGVEVLYDGSTTGLALATNQTTIAVSSESNSTWQDKVLVYTLSGNTVIASDSLYDTSGIEITGASLTSSGHSYSIRPTVSVVNQSYASESGTHIDQGTGLTVEVDGYYVVGNTSGVQTVSLVDHGSGYTTTDNVVITITDTLGSGATASVISSIVPGSTSSIVGVALTNPGHGYTAQPTATVSGGGGTGAVVLVVGEHVAASAGPVTSINLSNPGSGYTSAPTVTLYNNDTGGSGATANIVGAIVPEVTSPITSLTLNAPVAGYYTQPPVITFSGGSGTGASALPVGIMSGGGITDIIITDYGYGYGSVPEVVVVGNSTSPANVVAITSQNGTLYNLEALQVIDSGAGYLTAPYITIGGNTIIMQTDTIYKACTPSAGGSAGIEGALSDSAYLLSNIAVPMVNPVVQNIASTFGELEVSELYVLTDAGRAGEEVSSVSVATSRQGKEWVMRSVVDATGRMLVLGNIVVVNGMMYALGQQQPGVLTTNPVTNTKTFIVSSLDGIGWCAEETNIIPITHINSNGQRIIDNTLRLVTDGEILALIQHVPTDGIHAAKNVVLASADGVTWVNRSDVVGNELFFYNGFFTVFDTVNEQTPGYIVSYVSSDLKTWITKTSQSFLDVAPFTISAISISNSGVLSLMQSFDDKDPTNATLSYKKASTSDLETWVFDNTVQIDEFVIGFNGFRADTGDYDKLSFTTVLPVKGQTTYASDNYLVLITRDQFSGTTFTHTYTQALDVYYGIDCYAAGLPTTSLLFSAISDRAGYYCLTANGTSQMAQNFTVADGTVAGVNSATFTYNTRDITYAENSNRYFDPIRFGFATTTVSPTEYTLNGINLVAGGSGYKTPPTVLFDGSTTYAQATATVNYVPAYYRIDGLNLLTGGSGYVQPPVVVIAGTGSGAQGVTTVSSIPAHYQVNGVTRINGGSGYTTTPNITITGPMVPGGTPATASATIRLPIVLEGAQVTAPGAGYVTLPTVTVSPPAAPAGTQATATSTVASNRTYYLTGVHVTNPGNGYIVPPNLVISSAGLGEGASAAVQYIQGKFGSEIALSQNDQWMYVSAPGTNRVVCFKKNVSTGKFEETTTIIGPVDEGFGSSLSTNIDGSMLIVGAPFRSNVTTQRYSDSGAVYVYSRTDDTLTLQQTLLPTGQLVTEAHLGYAVHLSLNDNKLFVGAPGMIYNQYRRGVVRVYTLEAGGFIFSEEILKPYPQLEERFGSTIIEDAQSGTLFIGSKNAYSFNPMSIDGAAYTLDSGSTTLVDKIREAGSVYVYDVLSDHVETKYCFNQQLSNAGIATGDRFGEAIAVAGETVFVGTPFNDTAGLDVGKVLQFTNPGNQVGWVRTRKQEPKVDLDNVTRMYLYNQKKQVIETSLDYIDPAKGKILGVAEQDISFKTAYDPARYNRGNNPLVSVDTSFCWGSTQVGQVWWNLDSVRYIDYEQDTLNYRIKNWGKMFPGSIIDVLEWVESDTLPSAYTGNGSAAYSDNSAYVQVSTVNKATGVIDTKYYFWVRGKTTYNELLSFRRTSVAAIAELISSPDRQEIPYAAILRDNSVSLFNSTRFIAADDTVLHVDYSLLPSDTNIIHSEYELVQENSDSAVIPQRIVNKLIDSLTGIDLAGFEVPDTSLNIPERYGITIRPCQSMIVNRLTAVKNLVQYVNSVCKLTPVVQDFDLYQLYKMEEVPENWDTTGTGITVNSLAERSYLDTNHLTKGQKVLVLADESHENRWAIYEVLIDKSFALSRLQGFKTTDFWKTVDWFAATYDSTVKPTYTIETIRDLEKLSLKNKDVVRVKNNGEGKFVIYQVNAKLLPELVGIQDGTIQLSDKLWMPEYNQPGKLPSSELRNIINAVKDDIFKETLAGHFNKLFFILLDYILSEQKSIDWAFKTSYVSVTHKLRKLSQFPNYIKDNQTFYKEYLNEIKPYRTKIRDYIISYEGTEDAQLHSTDFDLPSYYDPDFKIWRSPNGEHARDDLFVSTLSQYADWNKNHLYGIESVKVEAAGHGYTAPPVLQVIGGGGTGAVLVADIDYYTGSVTKVTVVNPGRGYSSTPMIKVLGDGTDENSVQTCRCYPMLSNKMVRSFDTTLKFDRITYASNIRDWKQDFNYLAGDRVSYGDKAYEVNVDLNSGKYFNVDHYTLIADSALASAADRVMASYAPTVGMTPKRLERLFTGHNFPGNIVDGSSFIEPPANVEDTLIQSYFNMASGVAPEEIAITGGKFVDTFNSHAPEEFLPGLIYDTLDIQVFTLDTDNPTNAPLGFRVSKTMSAEMVTTFDGKTTTFDIPDINQPDTVETYFYENVNQNSWEFRRISEANTTTLAYELAQGDTVIHVTDASKLPIPGPHLARPGVIYVNGEKIIYYQINMVDNTLSQLRRSAWGTGAPVLHAVGSRVVDASIEQLIPKATSKAVWIEDNTKLLDSVTEQSLFIKASPAFLPG